MVRPDTTVHIPNSSPWLCSGSEAEQHGRAKGGCSIPCSQLGDRQDPTEAAVLASMVCTASCKEGSWMPGVAQLGFSYVTLGHGCSTEKETTTQGFQSSLRVAMGRFSSVSHQRCTRQQPGAWGNLSRDLYISATDGVATARACSESPPFQEARRMVLPRMKGTGDFFC